MAKGGQSVALADSRPVTFAEVFATLYHNLGIDAAHTVSSRHDRAGTLHSFAFVSQAVGRRPAPPSSPGSSSSDSETGNANGGQR